MVAEEVFVIGVGVHPFLKPKAERDYVELGAVAGRAALEDAGLSANEIELGVAGYCCEPIPTNPSRLLIQ